MATNAAEVGEMVNTAEHEDTRTRSEKIKDALVEAGYEIDEDDVRVELEPRANTPRVGTALIEGNGAPSVAINEVDHKTDLGEALSRYGYYCSTIRYTEEGLRLGIWESE